VGCSHGTRCCWGTWGLVSNNWGPEGWCVHVNWPSLQLVLVPQRHNMINSGSGRGNHEVSLATCCDPLGQLLIQLIEEHAIAAVRLHPMKLSGFAAIGTCDNGAGVRRAGIAEKCLNGPYSLALMDRMQRELPELWREDIGLPPAEAP